jgi:hypothetical protein
MELVVPCFRSVVGIGFPASAGGKKPESSAAGKGKDSSEILDFGGRILAVFRLLDIRALRDLGLVHASPPFCDFSISYLSTKTTARPRLLDFRAHAQEACKLHRISLKS